MFCASNYANMCRTNILTFKIIRILLYESNFIPGIESACMPGICVATLFINHI